MRVRDIRLLFISLGTCALSQCCRNLFLSDIVPGLEGVTDLMLPICTKHRSIVSVIVIRSGL